jgi:hypothetical protein
VAKRLEKGEELETVTLANIVQNGKPAVPVDYRERATQKMSLPNRTEPTANPRRAIVAFIVAVVLGLLASAVGLVLFRAKLGL